MCACVSIGAIGFVTGRLTTGGSPAVIASMGAAAVIVFQFPESPAARVWPILGGHLVSALIGVAVSQLITDRMIAGGVAVGLVFSSSSTNIRSDISSRPVVVAIMAPIGGGGLISGTCLALSHLAPGVEIFAAEPAQADDAARSFRAGHIIADDAPDTVADGLKVPLKDLTRHFVTSRVSDILTASERGIIDAMRLTWAMTSWASCAASASCWKPGPPAWGPRHTSF